MSAFVMDLHNFQVSVEVSSNWLFKTPKLIGILVLTEGQTVNKQKS